MFESRRVARSHLQTKQIIPLFSGVAWELLSPEGLLKTQPLWETCSSLLEPQPSSAPPKLGVPAQTPQKTTSRKINSNQYRSDVSVFKSSF